MLAKLLRIVKDTGRLISGWQRHQSPKQIDAMAHKILAGYLKEATPNIPVISEEDPDSMVIKRPKHYWLIDPIDGTASFTQGYHGYVTQAAYIVGGKPVLGAVYAPEMNLLYSAERSKGASLNGNKLSILHKEQMDILIDNFRKPRGLALEAFREFGFKQYIECGSISLKICRIADGTADVFLKHVTVRDWDVAPSDLIFKEVGGIMTDIHGRNFEYTGSYEHKGLVVCGSEKISKKIVCWYKNKNKRRT